MKKIVLLVAVVGLFAGCNKKESTDTGTTTPPATNSTPSTNK
jgi:hypothetical protein